MDVPSGASHLFLPKLSEREIRYEGGNWLEDAGAARKYGFASIQPLTGLHEFLARRRGIPGSEALWTRLSERDYVNHGRFDVAISTARRLTNPFAQHPSEDAARATALREQFPYYEMKDVAPHIDRLRLIKSPREIEILRYNGRISAEALKRAMQATAPGKYEYELEAEATYWMLKHGFQAAAYPAIVGSGPMGNQWHYEDNGRQMKAGELVVMDYAGSLDYLTMDITRTWPVSGRFTDAQLRAYECVLEAQKAIIAAIKPGVHPKRGSEDRRGHLQEARLRSALRLRRTLRRHVRARRRRLEPAVRGWNGDGHRTDPRRARHAHPHRGQRAGHAHRRRSPQFVGTERGRRCHGTPSAVGAIELTLGRCEALSMIGAISASRVGAILPS